MIPAYFAYAILLIVSFALYRNRQWLELTILGVPLLFCGYFLISIGIFSFGENMPFTYYNQDRKDEYGYVSMLVCIHFLVVVAAFQIIGRVDKKHFEANKLQQLKSLGLGRVGGLFCLLPVVFVLLSLSGSELWYRNSFRYDVETSNFLRFADLLVLVSAILIPFIRNTFLKYAVLASVAVAFLALGSRTAIVVLVVFSAMNLFVLQKARTWVSIILLLVAFWLLGTILLLRTYNLGGIAAVIDTALFGDYGAIIERVLYGFNYNFNLSFVLIAELLGIARTEDKWFYYGILPLPSAVFDQTELYDSLNRFRTNIPYSGFGYTLAHVGAISYLAFVFISSLAFLILRKFISVKRDIYEATLTFGVFAFPFIILLQYNLRTGTRIAYAFLVVFVLVAIWRNRVFSVKRQRKVRAHA